METSLFVRVKDEWGRVLLGKSYDVRSVEDVDRPCLEASIATLGRDGKPSGISSVEDDDADSDPSAFGAVFPMGYRFR